MVNNHTPKKGHLEVGRKGEEISEKYLLRKGYAILERNVKTGKGEVDIIAKDGETVVFVEVKTKKRNDEILPSERMDKKKIQRLRSAAETWIDGKGGKIPARIDMVGVCGEKVIEHYKDISLW